MHNLWKKCVAIRYWSEKLWVTKLRKVVNFWESTWPIFAGPVTNCVCWGVDKLVIDTSSINCLYLRPMAEPCDLLKYHGAMLRGVQICTVITIRASLLSKYTLKQHAARIKPHKVWGASLKIDLIFHYYQIFNCFCACICSWYIFMCKVKIFFVKHYFHNTPAIWKWFEDSFSFPLHILYVHG